MSQSSTPADMSASASGVCKAQDDVSVETRTTAERIKRPHNAWIIYRTEKSKELRDAFLQGLLPQLSSSSSAGPTHLLGKGSTPQREADLSKFLAAMWKSESPEVKEKYAERARAEREAHLQKYPGYRFQPRKSTKVKSSTGSSASAVHERESPLIQRSNRNSQRGLGHSSQSSEGSRSRFGDENQAEGGSIRTGRTLIPPPLTLTNVSPHGQLDVPMGTYTTPHVLSATDRGSQGQHPSFLQTPLSAPPEITSYTLAGNEQPLGWGPTTASRLPSMVHAAARADRLDADPQGLTAWDGRAPFLDNRWSSAAAQSPYTTYQHYVSHGQRSHTSEKITSLDSFTDSSAHYLAPDPPSQGSSRPSTIASEHWSSSSSVANTLRPGAAAQAPSSSPAPERHRSSSTYSSIGYATPSQGATGMMTQPHFFPTQGRPTGLSDSPRSALHQDTMIHPSASTGSNVATSGLAHLQYPYASHYQQQQPHHQQQLLHQHYSHVTHHQ